MIRLIFMMFFIAIFIGIPVSIGAKWLKNRKLKALELKEQQKLEYEKQVAEENARQLEVNKTLLRGPDQ